MNQLNSFNTWMAIRMQTAWQGLRQNERGEGLVSFVVIVVAVAALALAVLAVFEGQVTTRISELNLGG